MFFCAACLARELNLTALDRPTLLWKLRAVPGFEMSGRKCVKCWRGKRAIRCVGDSAILGAGAQVIVFLLTNKGIDLCDACLAFATEISLDEVRRVLASVESQPEFDRREGTCTVCTRVTLVTCAVADEQEWAYETHHVSHIVPYRGWRLGLLSYRTRAGWRPVVLIKGPVDSRGADAPSLLWDTFPSEAEADSHALKAAKEWIDKRCTD